MFLLNLLVTFLVLGQNTIVNAQLATGYPLGPTTSSDAKWDVKVCDVTKYGAVADGETDLGPPLLAAFNACSSGGIVNIPLGSFAMSTWVTLSGGTAWGINLEGTVYRTGTAGGHMIIIEDSTDFELYSSRSSGAIQGYGYQFHSQGIYGPRLIRLVNVVQFSVHDIALIDSPAFHLILDTCQDGEVYNLIIRGGNEGGLDGIDLWGFNLYIHDVEVTNKDECVTVKNPSNHILVENIFCNWSGGCAIGSLGDDTAISKVQYNNIYTSESNQMFMFKSNGGNGSVSDSSFTNFIGHANAYSLYIDAYWESTEAAGDGVLYTGLTFDNWKGTCAAGATRGPIMMICSDTQPCDGIVITDFAMWTESSSYEYYKCENAWGSGACLRAGSAHTSYAVVTSTVTATPSGYSAATMPGLITAGLGITVSIAIPTVPTTFFPGATPATARAYPLIHISHTRIHIKLHPTKSPCLPLLHARSIVAELHSPPSSKEDLTLARRTRNLAIRAPAATYDPFANFSLLVHKILEEIGPDFVIERPVIEALKEAAENVLVAHFEVAGFEAMKKERVTVHIPDWLKAVEEMKLGMRGERA